MPVTLSVSTSPACRFVIEAVSETRLALLVSVTETWPALPMATGVALAKLAALFGAGLFSSTTGTGAGPVRDRIRFRRIGIRNRAGRNHIGRFGPTRLRRDENRRLSIQHAIDDVSTARHVPQNPGRIVVISRQRIRCKRMAADR